MNYVDMGSIIKSWWSVLFLSYVVIFYIDCIGSIDPRVVTVESTVSPRFEEGAGDSYSDDKDRDGFLQHHTVIELKYGNSSLLFITDLFHESI